VGVLRTVAERAFATTFSSPSLSRVLGRAADLRVPPAILLPLIRGYVRVFGVDLDEAALPASAFPTFDAFFTRRLRPGARPVASGAGEVASPSDSRLSGISPVPDDARLEQVKGRSYSMDALLGSPDDASAFRRGVVATLYLSPAMYHRVHAPVDGCVTGWRYVPGRLFPVNGPAVRSVPGLFTRNERVVVFLDSPAHGPVAIVLVGAANVGRISLAFTDLVTNRGATPARVSLPSPVPVRRGDELGVFHLGSTVVLLVTDERIVPAAGATTGAVVKMGQALWRRS